MGRPKEGRVEVHARKCKRGRHIARYVSIFLLSGGYALPSLLPVYAADVTVPEVVVDASHPAVTMSEPGPINKKTTPTPPHREPNRNAVVGNAADLPLAGDVRNVVGNKLTIRATSAATMAGKGTMRTAKKDRTENTVNLVDGKVRNLYGGYTNGTGQTTGNTVTIGDGTNALPTGTNIAGYLYGGNKTVDTDNKLVVNTAVSVKNIKHFEKISFNISHVSNATTPLLKLTDGVQTSGIDWDKVEVTGANDFVPSTYRTRLATLMHNDQGIDFTKAGVNT